jgi:ABC-type multidrug transport system fused ATPase/permease subunit
VQKGKNDIPDFGWKDMARAVIYLLNKEKRRYLFFTSILLLILFYDLVPPFLVGKIVDFFTTYKPEDSLNPFYYLVAFLTVGHGVVSYLRLTTKYNLGKIQSQVVYNTKVWGFEKLLNFSVGWHDEENTGNKIQKIQNGIDAQGQLHRLLGHSIYPQATAIVGVLTAYTLMQPALLPFVLLYLAAFIFVQSRFYKRLQEINNEYNVMLERASGSYYEGLNNVLTIKTMGVKDGFKKNIMSKEELTQTHTVKLVRLGTDKWKWFQLVNAMALAGILLLIGNGYLKGAISLGSIFVFINYFNKLSGAIGETSSIIDSMVSFKISIARMMPIFWQKENIKVGTASFPSTWREINIKNGGFVYNSQNNKKLKTLKNINVSITQYDKIGIAGGSGSGKSTFVKILVGLYKLNSGTYFIDNVNFSDINHDDVIKNLSLVLQDSEMFNLTLAENITLMREMDKGKFERAIEISQLKDLINKLPDGINTLIGEKGYRLSGGERQRIGIARAIYKDSPIIILDEATSSLDSKTESKIQELMEKMLDKKTIISIAHRVSTLKNTKKILVFNEGKIVEQGTFEELSADKNSHFFSVYSRQRIKNN